MSLVRARIPTAQGDRSVNVSPEYAETHGLEILDEPTRRDDGRPRPESAAPPRIEATPPPATVVAPKTPKEK